ncbi:MAG: inositol monophosphatase [Planctomycetales bacterium]|nr:inositol monophosphatase [Planctomycetales bacterium]
MEPTIDCLLEVCLAAARAGAAQLLAYASEFAVREKSPADFVTDADLAAQEAIYNVVRKAFPEHGFLGEESPQRSELDKEFCWVVDPLDGTTNYVHQFPCYATSVAIARRGELLAGVVYDPVSDECFVAAKGRGATLNSRPVRVTQAVDLRSAMVAVSLPYGLTHDSPDLVSFVDIAPRCQAVRRTGSAALNLAYVACGRLDAHWACEINPWDAAAGVLLIQEAGGIVSGSDGRPFELTEADYLTAATPTLHAELLERLNAIDRHKRDN